MIIAVDGPSASGKGTIARALAQEFGLPYLDTGLLYRAVGYAAARGCGDPDVESDALAACDFDDALFDLPELRSEVTGGLASRVSVHPAVRQALLERQLAFKNQPGGAVLDGRDIGTVIAPEADAKLFITASAEARATRRFNEMKSKGEQPSFDNMLADIIKRDARDSSRATAPLKPAQDADLLDTSEMTIAAAVRQAIMLVRNRIEGR